jgi:hypothetical protein
MANPVPTANVSLLPGSLLPGSLSLDNLLPIHLSPIMLDIGRSLDVSANLALIKTDRRRSIASKTPETTPLRARIALPRHAMRKNNNRPRLKIEREPDPEANTTNVLDISTCSGSRSPTAR